MLENKIEYQNNLFGAASFGGSGDNIKIDTSSIDWSTIDLSAYRNSSGAGRAAGVVSNYINYTSTAGNSRDPQGVHDRPTFDEGDAYSGDGTYGSPDGR